LESEFKNYGQKDSYPKSVTPNIVCVAILDFMNINPTDKIAPSKVKAIAFLKFN